MGPVMRVVICVGFACLMCGCLGEDFLRGERIVNKDVDLSSAPAAPPEMAAKVHQVSESLMGASPFLGVSPIVYVVGSKQIEMYHPGPDGLMISQPLVEGCTCEEDLAGCLALELGKMAAETRAAKRMRLADPMKPLPNLGSTMTGSTPDDITMRSEMIFQESLKRDQKTPVASEDARKIAEEILQNANIPLKHLDFAVNLMKRASTSTSGENPTKSRPTPPQWSQ
jgi:hypothetical protein